MQEVYICDYVRTPIGKFGGALSSVRTDDLAAVPLRALGQRNESFDLGSVDDVVLGCANQAGEDNRNIARMSLLLAGYPEHIPGVTLNRLCGSGMDAVITAARAIKSGESDIVIAGGVESMSRAPFVMAKASRAFSRSVQVHDSTLGWRFVNPLMKRIYGVDSMPETAENLAEQFNVTRDDQDAYALQSQQRAAVSIADGRIAQEIVSVVVHQHKGKSKNFVQDEHPRPQIQMENLKSLTPLVKHDGTVTAGNSSGINDGAAALVIASEHGMKQNGLEPKARILGGVSTGIEPRVMGYGPVPATLKLCNRLKKSAHDFHTIEINEAFASQVIATMRGLGISETATHVNPNGGAISFGHPLGMSGARITGSAALNLEFAGDLGLATMCVGVGQGVAIALQRV